MALFGGGKHRAQNSSATEMVSSKEHKGWTDPGIKVTSDKVEGSSPERAQRDADRIDAAYEKGQR